MRHLGKPVCVTHSVAVEDKKCYHHFFSRCSQWKTHFWWNFWISSPKPDVWTGIRGNNKAQWKGPKDLITHQRRKHLSNWDHFSSSSAKKNSLRGYTHTHVGVYPQQHGGEQCMWEAVSLQYFKNLCRKSFKVVFFFLACGWLSVPVVWEKLTVCCTPVMFTCMWEGRLGILLSSAWEKFGAGGNLKVLDL